MRERSRLGRAVSPPEDPRTRAGRVGWKALRPLAILLLPGLITFIPGCAETFLLHPSTRPIENSAKQIELDCGLHIAGGAPRTSSASARRALAFVGNASRAEYAAPRWLSALDGVVSELWALNYPGFGRSVGDVDLDGLLPAASLFDRTMKSDGDDQVVLVGNSMGAAVALAVAANRDQTPDLLILQNVPPLDDLILKRHGWWNLWLLAIPIAIQVPNSLDAIENAKRCTGPAVFLIAKHDTTVPPDYQQDVIDAYAGPKTVIRYEGGHNARLPVAVVESLRAAVSGYLE